MDDAELLKFFGEIQNYCPGHSERLLDRGLVFWSLLKRELDDCVRLPCVIPVYDDGQAIIEFCWKYDKGILSAEIGVDGNVSWYCRLCDLDRYAGCDACVGEPLPLFVFAVMVALDVIVLS